MNVGRLVKDRLFDRTALVRHICNAVWPFLMS